VKLPDACYQCLRLLILPSGEFTTQSVQILFHATLHTKSCRSDFVTDNPCQSFFRCTESSNQITLDLTNARLQALDRNTELATGLCRDGADLSAESCQIHGNLLGIQSTLAQLGLNTGECVLQVGGTVWPAACISWRRALKLSIKAWVSCILCWLAR
jgi:hypothetical protein